MRQIGTLQDPDAARKLADYLLTQKIPIRLLEDGTAWGVWVCDEDQLARAREEFIAFQQNPTDPRYAAAITTARELREKEEEADESYRRKQVDMRQRFQEPTGSPRLTLVLMLASVGVSIAADTAFLDVGGKEIVLNNSVLQAVLIQPLRGFDLGRHGLTQVAHGEVWRLVTPIFIHFGIIHLLFNMLMLRDLGSAIELRRGSIRLALLVLVIAVPSNLAQYYLGHVEWHGGVVLRLNPLFGGMSGVLYGLFGYAWMKSRLAPDLGLYMDPNTIVLMIGWFFLCMTGLVGNVANVAHGAGLLIGIIIGAVPHLFVRHGG